MRYQKLSNHEAQWKKDYILKKHRDGERITRAIETDLVELHIRLLKRMSDDIAVEMWIRDYMLPEQRNKLRQSIRARRKRYFNAESPTTSKKSIDLDYYSWKVLSELADKWDLTLSETVSRLIDERNGITELLEKVKM